MKQFEECSFTPNITSSAHKKNRRSQSPPSPQIQHQLVPNDESQEVQIRNFQSMQDCLIGKHIKAVENHKRDAEL